VRVVRAVVSLMPLDDFVPKAAFSMAVVRDPDQRPDVVQKFEAVLKEARYNAGIDALQREAFYDRARAAFAIVATGEARLYGNLILKKGVVRP
jgi:L-fucose mutarotase